MISFSIQDGILGATNLGLAATISAHVQLLRDFLTIPNLSP